MAAGNRTFRQKVSGGGHDWPVDQRRAFVKSANCGLTTPEDRVAQLQRFAANQPRQTMPAETTKDDI